MSRDASKGAAVAARPNVAVVSKRSAYRERVEDKNDPRIRRLLAAGDPSVAKFRASHDEHEATMGEVLSALSVLGVEIAFQGRAGETFDSTHLDLVITVGGDGTLLSASHSVANVPILGINSAPSHSVGFFCGAQRGNAAMAIGRALRGELRRAFIGRPSPNDGRVRGHEVGHLEIEDGVLSGLTVALRRGQHHAHGAGREKRQVRSRRKKEPQPQYVAVKRRGLVHVSHRDRNLADFGNREGEGRTHGMAGTM